VASKLKPNGGFHSVRLLSRGAVMRSVQTSLIVFVGVQMIFVAMILVMVYILPESPRWLLAHRREDEAKRVLSMLNDHDISGEFDEIRTSIQAEQAAQVSWKQMFEGGLGTRRVLLGMVLQLAQQLSGVNALGYYLPFLLHRSVGLSETVARWVAAANAVSYFFTTTISITFVDKVGRRPLLMVGAAIMAVAFFGVATGVGIGGALPGSSWPGIVAVVFIWLYFTAFSGGWISIPWLYAAEVNGLSMRGKAASLGKHTTLIDLSFSSHSLLTVLSSSHRLRLARQLPRRPSNTPWHPPPQMGLLPHLRRAQRRLGTPYLLLPRRNPRPQSRRNRPLVPQQSRLVRAQSQPFA
jgi:hypothetical protein